MKFRHEYKHQINPSDIYGLRARLSAVVSDGKTEIAVKDDEYGSNGLGLAMVKSIAELHGGSVSVKSEPGQGSEFAIIL